MRDLLLEIGLEEMPARFITDSMNQLQVKVVAWLEEKRISFEKITAYSTPRRLALLIEQVAEKQEDIQEEAKGPGKKIALDENGNWSKAAQGFVRGQGVTVDDIFFKEIKGIEYVHVNKFIAGKETKELLTELSGIVTNMSFPKNMRWGSNDLRFIRPIKWIVALFGSEVIPMEITDVFAGKKSMGHRFLGSEITLSSPSEYEAKLREQFVIVDPTERKNLIRMQMKELENEKNWIIPVDEDLLEEVNNLVEYPTALFGSFESEFLEVPAEVLITSMKEHQRYFPVTNKDGELLPHFIAIRNGDSEYLENVAKGNEKVLRARLSDAAFFYDKDKAGSIDNYLEKLETIVFHEELGTIGDKVRRLVEISGTLAEQLQLEEGTQEQTKRTAEICKFDLVTNMVYEFPELQGIMGEKYARIFGEDELVAAAINEHYMPRSAEGDLPQSEVGAVVSVADKLDTIVGSFGIGLIPTGSQDPYALRRQASGIVSILFDTKCPLSLEEILSGVVNLFAEKGLLKRGKEEVLADLLSFFKLRLKYVLQEKGISHDIISAMLEAPVGDVPTYISRAETLQEQRTDESFKGIIESLSRVCNIAKSGEAGTIDEFLFEQDVEKELYTAYTQAQAQFDTFMKQGDSRQGFQALATLQPVIDAYFDNVMVMAEDEKVKRNRLTQMIQIANLITQFANVNDIIVK